MRNYYDVLGISRNASQAEIKAAYRSLAKKFHPDSAPESGEENARFQEIQEAYAVLSDPEKRKMYHYYGHEAYRKSYHAQHSSGDFWGTAGNDRRDSHEDGHCGACDQHRKPSPEEGPPPQAVRIAVWLDLEETLQTVVKDAYYTERMPNPDASSPLKTLEKEWKFQVKIPRESYDHQFFLLEDVIWGDSSFLTQQKRKQPDKLYVIIILLRDKPGFLRQGFHLYTDCMVDYHTLVLGGTEKITSLEGEILLDIPPGTVPEQKLRLKNHGLVRPKKMGGRGDLYVKLHIRIPRSLSPAQHKALEAFRDAMEACPDA
ncbi:MAG: DnaJ domain-containing protein [Eubacteriales bacterium]|nr:DnaJ domain-containing protein [Eubacteriales bacterium]